MILFTILLIILAIVTIASVVVLGVLGASGIVIFGDLLVCIWLIVCLIRFLWKRKK